MKGKSALRELLHYAFLPLLPVFFVLHGFVEHYPVVPVSDCLLLIAKYLLAELVLVVLFFLLLRSWEKAIFLSFILLLVFLFFGPIHDFLVKIAGKTFISKFNFLLPALLVFSIVAFIWIKRRKQHFTKLSKYLVILFIILLVFDLVQLVKRTSHNSSSNANLLLPNCDTCTKPDVYLIIADGYAGKKEMEQVLHFDNTLFENQLKSKGFFIVDSSLSNYNYTPFSVASLMNMDYLSGLEGRNKSGSDRQICYAAINSNPVVDFFEINGYNIKNYSLFRFNNQAPLVTNSFHKSGKELITQHSLWGRINRDLRVDFAFRHNITSEIARAAYHERELNKTLFEESFAEPAKTSAQPRFVYTHLSMPHYPYYFDKDGNPYPLNGLVEDATYFSKEKYLQYLQYSNKKLLALVDQVLTKSSKPPIILLMSDHGFREFKDEEAVDHKYQFINLNAVFLPGKNYKRFYKGISMVNQFRTVFNTEFGQQLPLLKDSCIYLTE